MPILMKHSGNAAPDLAGEFGAGLEKRSWEGANAELAQQRQHENIDYTYSAQQRAEFNKLSEAFAQAKSSGLFTPDQLIDVRRNIITRQAGILEPLPSLSKASAYPAERGIGKSWTADDGSGTVLTRDEKGQEKVLYKGTNLPDLKDTATLYKQAQETLTKKDVINGDTPPQPEAVEAYVMNAFRMHQKLRDIASGKIVPEEASAPIDPNATAKGSAFADMMGINNGDLSAASAPAGLPETAAPVVDANMAKIIATLPPEQAKIVSALVPKNADQARNQERILAIFGEVHAEYPLWSADKKRAEVKKRMEKKFGVTDL